MAHLLEYNWGKYYNRFINLYFVRKKMKIISRKEEKKELEYSERSRKSDSGTSHRSKAIIENDYS